MPFWKKILGDHVRMSVHTSMSSSFFSVRLCVGACFVLGVFRMPTGWIRKVRSFQRGLEASVGLAESHRATPPLWRPSLPYMAAANSVAPHNGPLPGPAGALAACRQALHRVCLGVVCGRAWRGRSVVPVVSQDGVSYSKAVGGEAMGAVCLARRSVCNAKGT